MQIEKAQGSHLDPKAPILVHTDLTVVDDRLARLHPSLHRSMGLRHRGTDSLKTLLVQNFVTGSSCLINRPLAELALPIPESCIMVDWWLALCAASAGGIEFETRPTVLYRQHGANAIGARPLGQAIRGTLRRAFRRAHHDSSEFVATLVQAEALESRLRERESQAGGPSTIRSSRKFVSDYLDIYRRGSTRIGRVWRLSRSGVRRQHPILDATLKLKLLTQDIRIPPRSNSANAPRP
jgi:hypothetical protein